jgi:flagellar biosynthesis protein FlhB
MKYWKRLTASARGETFNPLIYPSLICTLIYGLGFTAFAWAPSISASSLFQAMSAIHSFIPFAWGVIAVLTIVFGMVFLLMNKPPIGKFSGLMGFMLWIFAAFCWLLTGGAFVALAIALPNIWFWIWQYLSLAKFDKQDQVDHDAGIDRIV